VLRGREGQGSNHQLTPKEMLKSLLGSQLLQKEFWHKALPTQHTPTPKGALAKLPRTMFAPRPGKASMQLHEVVGRGPTHKWYSPKPAHVQAMAAAMRHAHAKKSWHKASHWLGVVAGGAGKTLARITSPPDAERVFVLGSVGYCSVGLACREDCHPWH